jgi:hypothetical protein
MKNKIGLRKLSRTSAHRVAMLRTMVTQLVHHDRIKTTVPKAKELRRIADRMVTWAKIGVSPGSAWPDGSSGTAIGRRGSHSASRRFVTIAAAVGGSC